MKGNYSVEPSFEPLGVRNAQILLMNPLVMWDRRRLYYLNGNKSIPWESKAIINCTYSKTHGVLMFLCEDWKLYVYTENLDFLTKIKWESKYTVCFHYIQQLTSFLMIGVSEVQLCKVQFNCNVRQTKFLSSMKCDITPIKTLEVDQKTKLKWHKGFEILQKENLLYVWSLQDINFYHLDTLEIFARMENITKKEAPLTKAFLNTFYKYIVVGYTSGQIKVWKMPEAIHEQRVDIIHTFTYHTKSIANILKAEDNRQFLSVSADSRVGLWNLDTFQLLYSYDFSTEYQQIWLYDYKKFYASRQGNLGVCDFGCRLEFICNLNSKIIHVDKLLERSQLQGDQGRIISMQLTLNTNLGLRLQASDVQKPDVNKANTQYFYPPLKSKSIHQIISCPFQPNRFYFLVENGQIYRSRIEANSGKIQSVINIQRLIDYESHQLNQTASVVKFLRLTPPKFDSQIIGRVIQEENQEAESDSYLTKQLMTVGCNKGAIVFVQRNVFQKIHTRITYHREAIMLIETIISKDNNETFLISLCQEMFLKIVRFDQEKASCLHSLAVQQCIESYKTCDDKMFCAMPKGILRIFSISKEGQLSADNSVDANDHEDAILSLDFDHQKRLLVTSGVDYRIKIWTFNKILLWQVTSSELVETVVLSNDLDVVIAHGKKMSLLRRNYFRIRPQQLERLQQEEENIKNRRTIQQIVQKMRFKKKEQTNLKKSIQSIGVVPTLTTEKTQMLEVEKPPESPLHSSPNRTVAFNSQPMIHEVEEPKQTTENTSKNLRKSAPHRRTQPERKRPNIIQIDREDLQIVDRHLSNLNKVRKSNMTQLPRLNEGKQSLFDQFMRAKLLNKKILTRRDITLNRIIMKNIIREYIGADIMEGLSGVKYDV